MSRRNRSRQEKPGPAGFFVVNKPSGCTSHDMVDAARRWFGTRRVGHMGTLDPQATGVLPLAIREVTKLISFVQDTGKTYRARIRLGAETDTLDRDGRVLNRYEGALPSSEKIEACLRGYLGEIQQVPPMFSAVKHQGVPLHKLARRGKEVEREPRKVCIDEIKLLERTEADLEIYVRCSAGTYVRTLASDLGRELGCGAYLEQLCRLKSGPFALEQAHDPGILGKEPLEPGQAASLLIPPAAVLGLPAMKLTDREVRLLAHGGSVQDPAMRPLGERVMGLAPSGSLVAILEGQEGGRLAPLRVMPTLAGSGSI